MADLNKPYNSLVKLIDDGKFFVNPMCWWFWVKGCILFLLPLFGAYKITDMWSMMSYATGYQKTIFFVMSLLLFVALCAISYYNFVYWRNRAHLLPSLVKPGDRVVAMPLVANNIKFTGEALGMLIAAIGTTLAILAFVFMILSGVGGFYSNDFIEKFLLLLLGCVGLTLGSWILGYGFVILARFISESINIRVHITNDLRDIADVERNATVIVDNTECL